MTIETTWKLSADIQDEMTTEGGTFQNVVTNVHWRCIATDSVSGEELAHYGSKAVPAPTDASSYIDLSALQSLSDEQKRATVLGWAEAIEPGFVEGIEARVTAALEAKMAAPVITAADIL